MDNTLYLLAASMDLAGKEQSRLANNLANSQTPGFKEILSRIESVSSTRQVTEGIEEDSTTDLQFPFVHRFQSTTQGQLQRTDDPADLALEGEGFLVVKGENETRYLRGGRLRVDAQGFLVTSQGFKVEGDNGPVVIPAGAENDIAISPTGGLEANGAQISNLKIVKFANSEELVRDEGTYIAPPGTSPVEDKDTLVHQGFLESSNVEGVQAMTDVIANMRYFEAIQKVTQTLDQSWQNLMRQGR